MYYQNKNEYFQSGTFKLNLNGIYNNARYFIFARMTSKKSFFARMTSFEIINRVRKLNYYWN